MGTEDKLIPEDEDIFSTAERLFLEQRELIQALIPSAQVEHVGSSSIKGSINVGDLDIQVRVVQEDFRRAEKALQSLYKVHHPELRNDQFAIFKSKEYELPIGVMLTVIDSKYDEFYKQRDLLRNNPTLLAKYNDLKRSFEGKPIQEYKKAKSDLFGPNGDSRFLKNFQ
jgi:GrpB-like predicted nucleotidyltransferase (UPF0157 family)